GKVPESYKRLKRRLDREYPENPALQRYAVEDYLKQKEHETDEEWIAHVERFKSYFWSGDTYAVHSAVDDWGRRQFRKHRKEIQSLLREYQG
ncbi:MAG: hypothetical protein ACREBU_25500, partial [Nitrososphaera sp.]